MSSILIVDDEQSIRKVLKIFLDKQGYNISTATKLADADYYVVSTTATTFQVSSDDGGSPLEFELWTSTDRADAKVKVFRYVYPASETGIVFTLYKDGAVSPDLFHETNDIGKAAKAEKVLQKELVLSLQ